MFRKMLAALTVIAVCSFTTTTFANQYAAIAYSRSTWTAGCSHGQCLDEVESAALATCGADDAVIMVYTQNQWCAVAAGSDGSVGWGFAGSQEEAEANALSHVSDSSDAKVTSEFSGTDE